MNFDQEKIRALGDKLRTFGTGLGAEEQALLAAMLRLGGQALPKERPAQIAHVGASSNLAEVFEQALQPGSGSTLVRGRSAAAVTVDVPPVNVTVGLPPVAVSVTTDPEPITIG